MKEVYKTLAVLVCWSIAAVAYASDECMHGDIRLRETALGNTAAGTGGLEVCVRGNWTTVCNTGGWHSNTLNGISNNTRVACRQQGYREEGATFTFTLGNSGPPKTDTGLRQGMCSGSELQLIACPDLRDYRSCSVGVKLTCQLATCKTTIRLRGGRTATEGRVEVCRDGQWGTVCDDSWEINDASVACRQLGLSNFIAVPVPNDYFGLGIVNIHLQSPQCNGSEAALTNCTSNTQQQCSHDQDASVVCLTNTSIPVPDTRHCTSEYTTIEYYDSATIKLCLNQEFITCNKACQDMNGVTQLGAYFCGSGEITQFLMNSSQLYECPISGAGEFLICEPTTQTTENVSTNCQKVWQDFELQAASTSIAVVWENAQYFESYFFFAQYTITCSPEGSNLQHSIVLNSTTSEVTMENLPHSTTYECCVTLHIGRYSTRACNNTATLADQTTVPDGASIGLGVLVAVLVLLLVLATGAMLYLLIMRGKHKEGNASQSSTNRPQEYHLENPQYTTSPTLTPPSSTPHTLTTAAPPHTLTPPFPTEPHQYNNVVDTPMLDFTYDVVGEKPKRMNKSAAKLPTNGAPLPAREAGPEEGVQGSEYSVLNRPEVDLVYAVVDKKAKKKNRQAAMTEAAYEAPNATADSQGWDPDEYSRLQR